MQTVEAERRAETPRVLSIPALPSYDLTRVMRRVAKAKWWWSRKRLSAAEQGYREYHLLIKTTPGVRHPVPSYDVDQVWHNHLLYSEQYEADTVSYLGRFLHHRPRDYRSDCGSVCDCGDATPFVGRLLAQKDCSNSCACD